MNEVDIRRELLWWKRWCGNHIREFKGMVKRWMSIRWMGREK